MSCHVSIAIPSQFVTLIEPYLIDFYVRFSHCPEAKKEKKKENGREGQTDRQADDNTPVSPSVTNFTSLHLVD